MAQVGVEQPRLLLAACKVADVTNAVTPAATQPVPHETFLKEECEMPMATNDDRWYLETGASNHMTGLRDMLTQVDGSMRGTVGFGDGSMVRTCGGGWCCFRARPASIARSRMSTTSCNSG